MTDIVVGQKMKPELLSKNEINPPDVSLNE
jgi:hypothetical protein